MAAGTPPAPPCGVRVLPLGGAVLVAPLPALVVGVAGLPPDALALTGAVAPAVGLAGVVPAVPEGDVGGVAALGCSVTAVPESPQAGSALSTCTKSRYEKPENREDAVRDAAKWVRIAAGSTRRGARSLVTGPKN